MAGPKLNATILRVLSERQRRPYRQLPAGVSRTQEADMITFEDDESTPRFKMPCGHAIGAESLKEYCKSEMRNGKCEFRCPECRREWTSSLIRAVADLSRKENQEFDIGITENFMFKSLCLQTCQKCKSYCYRENRRNPRVICPVCEQGGQQFEFCWYCLRQWKTGGTDRCGNDGCSGEDPGLTILRNSSTKVMEYNGVTCPSIRACPSCFMLVEHIGGCKTMCCSGCNQGFCFICLKKSNKDGNLPCGNYNVVCDVAPLQKDLFQ